MGIKTETSSTGPQNNSAFVMKVNDTLPPLLLTAHHVVAGIGIDRYVKWNEIGEKQKNAWAWSMYDDAVNFKVGTNLPIRNAETLKLDLAAFYMPDETTLYLKPSLHNANVGDTVYLYSKIIYKNNTTFMNEGVVVHTTDSLMVYELADFEMASIMNGTSGSCVLNKEEEVIANSFGGFTIPNDSIKHNMLQQFPLLKQIPIKNGRVYGVGLPISIIKNSIVNAFAEHAGVY